MILFLKLLLAHLIGAFCFLPEKWIHEIESKKERCGKLYLNVGIYSLLLFLSLGFDWHYGLGCFVISLMYFLGTVLKVYFQSAANRRKLFFATQLLHLITLAAVVYAYEPYDEELREVTTSRNLVMAVSLVFVTFVSAEWTRIIISKWTPSTEDEADESLVKAGKYIGILERLFVFGFIVTDHWEAVGFLLAAKSVFRFGDLKESKDRKLTEYILIGTLFSFGLAIVAGLGYNYFMGKV